MRLIILAIVLTVLLAILAFCAVGILATFEPPGWPMLRMAYAGGAFAALLTGGMVIRAHWNGPGTNSRL